MYLYQLSRNVSLRSNLTLDTDVSEITSALRSRHDIVTPITSPMASGVFKNSSPATTQHVAVERDVHRHTTEKHFNNEYLVQHPISTLHTKQDLSVYNHPQQQNPVCKHPQQQNEIYNHPQQQLPVYNHPQQQNEMYNHPQQQLPVYSHPQQQNAMYNHPQQQLPVYSHPQQQNEMYSRQQRQHPVYKEPMQLSQAYDPLATTHPADISDPHTHDYSSPVPPSESHDKLQHYDEDHCESESDLLYDERTYHGVEEETSENTLSAISTDSTPAQSAVESESEVPESVVDHKFTSHTTGDSNSSRSILLKYL